MKKAQIAITFNWAYILIAGAAILLFFAFIVVQQKDISEKKLGGQLINTMESIYTAAGVSEKTKNYIQAGGLSEYTLSFSCEEGVSEFGINDLGVKVQNSIDPLFAPLEINPTQIITWSLPYKLPYKTIDLLMVTSSNTKYFVFGTELQKGEFINITEGLNLEYFTEATPYGSTYNSLDSRQNFHTRIVDWNGVLDYTKPVPPLMATQKDRQVSAVSFTSIGMQYYSKEGNLWKKQNINPVSLVSLGGDRDAAKFAAMIAGNSDVYQCNMQKAFQRLQYVTEVYSRKTAELIKYYDVRENLPSARNCLGYLNQFPNDRIDQALDRHKNTATRCKLEPDSCLDLVGTALKVRETNDRLQLEDCIKVY